MNDQNFQQVLDQADELIHKAHEELSRPAEDVVNYMVCRSAFKAVEKYLTGFLIKHGAVIPASASLEVLLKQCRKIDPKFKKLKLDPLFSTRLEEDVWMDAAIVNTFLGIATESQKLVNPK